MSFRYFLLCICLLFNVSAANAEASGERFESLNHYLIYTEKNNNDLKSLFYKWKATISKAAKVEGYPDPKISFVYFLESVETRVGPQQNKYSLSQKIPWFGKLSLKGEIVASEAKAIEQELVRLKLEVDHRVTSLYSEFYYLAKSVEITKANIKLMNYFESVARTRYKTGQAPHSAIIKAQVEIGKLEDKLITLKTLKRPIVQKLNALMGRDRFSDLSWPKNIPRRNLNLDIKELRKRLALKNPTLKALGFKTQKYQDSISLAKKQYFPDFTLGVSYVDTDKSVMEVVDNGKDPLAIGVTMTLPIWFGKNSAGVQEARSMHQMIKSRTAQKKLDLNSDLELSLYSYNNSKRRINLYKETLIPKAEQSLRVTREAFEASKVNFLSLIDAERVLLEFELLYHKSLAGVLSSFSKVELIVGEKLNSK